MLVWKRARGNGRIGSARRRRRQPTTRSTARAATRRAGTRRREAAGPGARARPRGRDIPASPCRAEADPDRRDRPAAEGAALDDLRDRQSLPRRRHPRICGRWRRRCSSAARSTSTPTTISPPTRWCGSARRRCGGWRSQTGETCQFCMPVGNKYAVVSMQNSARLFRIGSDVGVLVPIPWTASGRFFVAHMTPRRTEGVHPAGGLPPAGRRTRRPAEVPRRGEGGARRRHLRHHRARRRVRDLHRRAGRRPCRPLRRLHLLHRLERDRREAHGASSSAFLLESAKRLSAVPEGRLDRGAAPSGDPPG